MADNNTITQNLTDLELPATTSQPLAAGLGATPQQVAMTGTQAQKQATIADRIAVSAQPQLQELSRVQRLDTPKREATVEEALETERQEKLAKLGNIGQSIQSRIQQSFAQAAQQQVGQQQVGDSQLASTLGLQGAQLELAKQDPNSNYSQISTTLNQFLASGDPNDLETAFKTMDNLKAFGVSSADAKRLVGLTQSTMAKQTGQTVAENVMDQVVVQDLDLQELGFEGGSAAVAELLGMSPEELNQLSVDELSDTIEAKQQSEFAKVDSLKAQLDAAPLGSIQREILMKELRDLGQVGITGVEEAFAETVDDIDLAGSVKIGDEQVKIADFLNDENLSQMVSDWINEDDPVKKEELIPSDQFPELVKWVESNQMALAKVSETADDTKEKFDAANQDYKALNVIGDLGADLTSDVMSKLMPGWDPTQSVTSSDLAEAKAKFSSSTVGKLASDIAIPTTERKNIVNKINALPPEMVDEVINLSPEGARLASSAAEVLNENTQLSNFLGLPPNKGFILDEETQDKIAQYDQVVEDISKSNPIWLTNPSLKTVSPESLQTLLDNPSRYDDVVYQEGKKKEIEAAQTVDDTIKSTLGADVTFEELQSEYNEAQKWGNLGDPESQAKLDTLRKILNKKDTGPLTEADINSLGETIKNNLNVSLEDVINGKWDSSQLKKLGTDFNKRLPMTGPRADFATYKPYIENGEFTENDLQNAVNAGIPPDMIGNWLDTTNVNVDINGFKSYPEYAADLQAQRLYDIGSGELALVLQDAGIDDLNILFQDEKLREELGPSAMNKILTSEMTNKLTPQLDAFAKTSGYSDWRDVGSSWESESNVIDKTNFDRLSHLWQNSLLPQLTTLREAAEGRGETLVVNTLNSLINKNQEGFNSLQERRREITGNDINARLGKAALHEEGRAVSANFGEDFQTIENFVFDTPPKPTETAVSADFGNNFQSTEDFVIEDRDELGRTI